MKLPKRRPPPSPPKTPSAPSPVDLARESVAGEEDPGASLEDLARPDEPRGPNAPVPPRDEASRRR